MFKFEVTFQIPGSGAGIVKQVVGAASDYNARRLIMAQFPTAQILNCTRVG
jgi:hypothetical protein